MTAMFLLIILAVDSRSPPGICTDPAVFVGGWTLEQLCPFPKLSLETGRTRRRAGCHQVNDRQDTGVILLIGHIGNNTIAGLRCRTEA